MAEQTHTREEQLEKLNELIKDVQFAMFTTVEPDGTLRARPMSTQKAEFDGTLWFFTKASAPKVDEVEMDQHVCVSYAKPEKQHYISMSGLARVIRNRDLIEQMWTPELKAWFPGGKEDPDLALLKVEVTQAEYWDSYSSGIAHLFGLAKSVATGQTYQPGENEKVNL